MTEASESVPEDDDALVTVLDQLTDVVDKTTDDAQALRREIGTVRKRRAAGGSAVESLSGPGRSTLLAILNRMAKRLSSASGQIRRGLVGTLVGEGERVSGVAKLFGVSHQRVSSMTRKKKTTPR